MSVIQLVATALAGDAAEVLSTAAAEAPASGGMSQFSQLFGWAMWPLWLCSIILIALIVERRKKLTADLVYDPAMLNTCCDLIGSGKIDEAEQTARGSDTVIGKAWAQGLHEFQLGGIALGEALTTASTLALKPLKRNLGAISTIAAISPLFGLLGTIIGMILTFSQINADGGADKAELAGGISMALFTTAAGLIVAIPAIVSGRWFTAKLTGHAEVIEAAINRAQYRFTHHQAQATKTESEKTSPTNAESVA
jgi:biopolymer transport protein ExbB